MAVKKTPKSQATQSSTKPPDKDTNTNSTGDFSTARYERQIVAESAKRESPTYVRGKALPKNLESQARYRVYELDLDKEDDTKEPIIIAGNPAMIALQASLLKAFDQILEQRVESDLDFKRWAEDFEQGYSRFVTGVPDALKKEWRKYVWPGIEKNNRPKVIEIKVPGSTPDYHVVLVQRDRSDANSEIVRFSGTYRQIQDKIELWWQIQSEAPDGTVAGGKRFTPTMVGQPQMTLRFFNTTTRDRGEKIIRIMTKTDDPFSDLPKISNSDIRQYATKILEQFNGYVWKKGREVTSYKGPIPKKQGLDGWAYRTSESVGVDLFTRLAAVAGATLDRRYLKHTQTDNESLAYPTTPQTAVILGKTRELPLKRPVVDVKFTSASIRLNSLGQEVLLVKSGKVVYEDL